MSAAMADMLIEWERRQEEGTPVTAEELCSGWPEGLSELRKRIRRLEVCNDLLGLAETTSQLRDHTEQWPSTIGDYDILGRLGRGGNADVLDAWDRKIERAVAIKVLRPPLSDRPIVRDEELIARFTREGLALGKLDEDYIVPVYRAGEWEGRPFLVMKRMAGSLSDRLTEMSSKGPRSIAAFVEKVARAVQCAHSADIFHRDLKPANILLDKNGNPRVSDFGLAKFWTTDDASVESNYSAETATEGASALSTELTFPGVQPGTPSYMAPEQHDPTLAHITPATDVWALGVILYEMITGVRPFAAGTRKKLAEQICRAPTPSCSKLRRRVPRWLDRIVERCLEKDPSRRFTSAEELANALRQGLRPPLLLRPFPALTMVAVASIVVVASILYTPKPKQPPPFEKHPQVVDALNRLRQKHEVVLVGNGVVAPYRWVWGDQAGLKFPTTDGTLSLESYWPNPAPVEFLPSLPPGRYSIELVVGHVAGVDYSRVCLYADSITWATDTGTHFGAAWIEYADWGELATGQKSQEGSARALFQIVHLINGDNAVRRFEASEYGHVYYNSAEFENRQLAPFRTLTLELTPTAAKGVFDKKSTGPRQITRAEINRFPGRKAEVQADADPTPDRGGVGLVVNKGRIVIQSFRIVPLPEPD